VRTEITAPAGASLDGIQGLDLNGHWLEVYNRDNISRLTAPPRGRKLSPAIKRAILTRGRHLRLDGRQSHDHRRGRQDQSVADPYTRVQKALKADANLDGIVDVADLGILGLNWGSTAAGLDFGNADFTMTASWMWPTWARWACTGARSIRA